MYQRASGVKKVQISTVRYSADDHFRAFIKHIETNNVYQVKSRLRDRDSAIPLVATAEEENGNTAPSIGVLRVCRDNPHVAGEWS